MLEGSIPIRFLISKSASASEAETLSTTIVVEIIGVMLGYFAKAFFGKREEENLKYKREGQEVYLLQEEPEEQEVNEEEAKG